MANRRASDEYKVLSAENSGEVLTAFNRIPYSLINAESDDENTHDVLTELAEIVKYYKEYYDGVDFTSEGTNGDYIPAKLNYRMTYSLINKEARFLFAEAPDIEIQPSGIVGTPSEELMQQINDIQVLVDNILDVNNFEQQLLKAAKDCFVGKRVAAMVNFNEVDGCVITFLPSTQFLYETRIGNQNVLTKFVAFIIVHDSMRMSSKRIFKKKFEVVDDVVYLEEALYDGAGRLLEDVTPHVAIQMDRIPAVVIVNDGLTGDYKGESEVNILDDYEGWFSKLSNADIDAQRKSMNPIIWTLDMESASTKGLSSSPGSHWDLGSDQNLENSHAAVGILESNMNYSNALSTSLDRVKANAYEDVDMPNVTLESMQGAITTGKALKAIYWPLIVRCKEKMTTWGPKIRDMIRIIVDGAILFPSCVDEYLSQPLPSVSYEVHVEQNNPLPEDETEDKANDMAEVESSLMSRKTYMKKWHGLTDDEVQAELEQIALERQILEDTSFSGVASGVPYPEVEDESDEFIDENELVVEE